MRLDQIMHPHSAAAVRRHAIRLGGEIRLSSDSVEIYSAEIGEIAAVHRDDDGRWVRATWSDHQWQSDDCPAMSRESSYRYTTARSLRGLRSIGVRSYPTAAAALAEVTD